MIRGLQTDSPSEDARPDSRHPWTKWQLPALGLLAVFVVAVAAYLLINRSRSNPEIIAPADMVFADPVWAMHASMQDMAGMMNGAGPTQAGAAEAGTPLLEMNVRFYDFGSLSGSREVSHSFVLANRGDAPLIITHAYATCGCTNAVISAAVIPPGKAGLVTVYLTPMTASGGSQAIRRGIILETNDPLNPQIEIWVQAALE